MNKRFSPFPILASISNRICNQASNVVIPFLIIPLWFIYYLVLCADWGANLPGNVTASNVKSIAELGRAANIMHSIIITVILVLLSVSCKVPYRRQTSNGDPFVAGYDSTPIPVSAEQREPQMRYGPNSMPSAANGTNTGPADTYSPQSSMGQHQSWDAQRQAWHTSPFSSPNSNSPAPIQQHAQPTVPQPVQGGGQWVYVPA